MDEPIDKSCVDCDEGRRLGCRTFCCRMLVRLRPEEIEKQGKDGLPPKTFVEKDERGLCVNFDGASGHCKIWEKRPYTCRNYECNSDFLLQVVLRDGFINIAETVKAAAMAYIPKECYIEIPLLKS